MDFKTRKAKYDNAIAKAQKKFDDAVKKADKQYMIDSKIEYEEVSQ